MKCDICGQETNVATINSKHELVCDYCLFHPSRPRPIDGVKAKDVIDEMYDKIKT